MKEEEPINPLGFKYIFSTAFRVYQNVLFPSLVGLFILMIIISGLTLFLFPIVFKISFHDFSDMLMNNPKELAKFISSGSFFVNSLLYGTLINCIIAPMGAGILQGCKFAFEKNPVPIKTIFSFYNSSYTSRIISFTLFLKLTETLMSLITSYIGLPSLNMSFLLLLWVLTIFCIPMIIFENLSLSKALSTSSKTIVPYMITIFLFLLLSGIIVFSGLFLFGLGIIITFPFWYAMIFTLYFALRGVKGNLVF